MDTFFETAARLVVAQLASEELAAEVLEDATIASAMGASFSPIRDRMELSIRFRAAAARRKLGQRGARTLVARRLRALERETRAECWCGGTLQHSMLHRSYGVCEQCGAYVNSRPPVQTALAELYSLDFYWRRKQRADGMPRIEERPARDWADGRIERWLRLVEQHARPIGGSAIEIGCAHAAFLAALSVRGWRCTGVEIDPDVAAYAAAKTGLDIRAGTFPDIDLPQCDLFLAFDVLEHVYAPDRFMAAAARILTEGGTAIIQAPIVRGDEAIPFGDRFRDAFDGVEHLFVFTDPSIELLARRCNLEIVDASEALWPIGEIVVLRKR